MKKNLSIRALRQIAKLTQGEFATLVGASKIAVTSWERGVKKLSRKYAHRIAHATGASVDALVRGDGKNLGIIQGQPYTLDMLRWWRENCGVSTPEAADKYLVLAEDSLRLILRAAAAPGLGKAKGRLPGVWLSLMQWMKDTVRDFNLLPEIDAQLKRRAFTHSQTMTYGQWRAFPDVAKSYGFKDNRKKPDSEKLTLECRNMRPGWSPGSDMRPQKAKMG